MGFIYILAPMENLTDPAFRAFCYRKGADLTMTEMIRIEALAQGNENAWAKIKSYDDTPTLIQLLGNNEIKLEKFLKQFKPEHGFKGFNLNIGCPNPDIIKLGQGAAMIKRINKVKTMVSVFRKYNYPISIKMRLGLNEFEKEKKVYLTLIKEIDADFFIVHARHGKQTYKDNADFLVYEKCVKTGKKIIANGDIKTKEQIDFLGNYVNKHFAANEFPSLVELSTGDLYCYPRTPIWGALYYDGYRKESRDFFSPKAWQRISYTK